MKAIPTNKVFIPCFDFRGEVRAEAKRLKRPYYSYFADKTAGVYSLRTMKLVSRVGDLKA